MQHISPKSVLRITNFPDQGLNSGPQHWEHGVFVIGLPGKPLDFLGSRMLHIFCICEVSLIKALSYRTGGM